MSHSKHQVEMSDAEQDDHLNSTFFSELLIRTSGESRLSDFLLWQCSQSCLIFLSVLWPDFSAWHFYYSILLYQREYPKIQVRMQRLIIAAMFTSSKLGPTSGKESGILSKERCFAERS